MHSKSHCPKYNENGNKYSVYICHVAAFGGVTIVSEEVTGSSETLINPDIARRQ
jgi:hypothetical protein